MQTRVGRDFTNWQYELFGLILDSFSVVNVSVNHSPIPGGRRSSHTLYTGTVGPLALLGLILAGVVCRMVATQVPSVCALTNGGLRVLSKAGMFGVIHFK